MTTPWALPVVSTRTVAWMPSNSFCMTQTYDSELVPSVQSAVHSSATVGAAVSA